MSKNKRIFSRKNPLKRVVKEDIEVSDIKLEISIFLLMEY